MILLKISLLAKVRLIWVAAIFANCWTTQAQAWGLRGHHIICESAVFLVEDETLQLFLKSRIPLMGHLCNVPDTSWRSKTAEINALGAPTHYIDPEVIGLPIREMPLDFQKLQQQFEGKTDQFKTDRKIFSLAKDMGSLFWRTDQLFRRAIDFGKVASANDAPSSKEVQNADNVFNKNVLEMVSVMGVMGHFIGDASMPFHSTADYDGWAQGHGGIHSFYEEEMVAAQDEKLTLDVITAARKLFDEVDNPRKKRKSAKPTKSSRADKFKAKMSEVQFLKLEPVLEKMRALSAISADDIGLVLQNDPIAEKSTVKLENGIELKSIAKRKPTEKTVQNYRPIIVKHLARSATLLAQMWEEIYEKAGQPKVTSYKLYKFPFEPEFIPPNYILDRK